MPLKAINITIQEDGLTTYISDILFEMGALSVSTTDLNYGNEREQPIFAVNESWAKATSPKPWKNSKLTAIYPLSTDVEAIIMHVATYFNLPSTPTFSIQSEQLNEKTPDEWVRQVQSSFQPIELGRVRISFPWHARRDDVVDVRIEPGVAFGTGEHPTTKMCVSWLSRVVKPGTSMLDFGTGSGVLAIAAVMLAENVSAVGIDIDSIAVNAARQNAALSGVERKVHFCENQDEPQGQIYNIIVANILARPLKELAKHLLSQLQSGAFIALSGLLVCQAPQLVEWYAKCGVSLHDAEVNSGWAMLVFVKR